MTFPDADLGGLVADIVSAYVANHKIAAAAVPELIRSVQIALSYASGIPDKALEAPREPAVPIKKSVLPDYIVCLEDGKKLKMLRRHLKTAYNMEPHEYRAKWGLPESYPMTAPNYTKLRSGFAKQNKLGQRVTVQLETSADAAPVVQMIPAGRRGKKTPVIETTNE